MADRFDMEDIIYNAIASKVSIPVYKGRSADGMRDDHVTIRVLTAIDMNIINRGNVNANIFLKRNSNGSENRQSIKMITRQIKDAIRGLKAPCGMYWQSRIVWSESLDEAKEGFDCMNIRLEINTEID